MNSVLQGMECHNWNEEESSMTGRPEPQEQRIVTRRKMKNAPEMALGTEDLTLCLMTLKKMHDKKK